MSSSPLSVDSKPPSLTSGVFPRGFIVIVIPVLLGLTLHGCASSAPSIDNQAIRRKLDLRLQMALGSRGVSEQLGNYMRVIVRLEAAATDEDRQMLSQLGSVGSVIGPVVTLTLKPERVVEVAALPQVKLVEFDARNVPMPTPPPQIHPIPEKPEASVVG